VGGLVLGIVLQVALPWRLLSRAWIGHAVGWPIALAGALLSGWAVVSAADLDIENPARIVMTGPFAWSRNPMYLGWSGIYLGFTLVVNTVWLVLLLPVVLGLIHLVVLREERALERRFGAGYAAYRSRTRRYL
jgi:protein-S-isoprenylcysteine O-methyltransferase Ste14